MTERRVDLVRVERPQQVYDVEEVFGRDARSVFPSQSAAAAAAAASSGQLSTESVREMLGAKKFVTETELEALKAARGGGGDQGEPLKPLVEVLREAKEKKESAFADGWKQMKTGKNRPLDEDELLFLDSVAEAEAARVRKQMEDERREMDEFRRATAEAQAQAELEVQGHSVGPQLPAQPKPELKRPAPAAAKPVIRAVFRPKAKPGTAGQTTTGQPPSSSAGTGDDSMQGAPTPHEAQEGDHQVKKQRLDGPEGEKPKVLEKDAGDEADAGGLAGLLGGYDSSSEGEG